MPIVDLVCIDCDFLIEDARLTFPEMEKVSKGEELSNVECPKCSCTKFHKVLSAHGKNSSDWSKWSRR